jgi:hypothetical protein
MITLEELKQKYPVKDVAPYGSCIIVPGSEFNPDWEAELDDQGVKVFMTSLDQRPVTLVQVKKQVGVATLKGSDETAVLGSELWSSGDEQRLLKRMSEISGSLAEKISIVTLEFPCRTPIAVKKKYAKLRHAVKAVTPSQAQRTSSKTRVMFDPESRWTDSDKELLAKLWNQKLKVRKIMLKFPKRSQASIKMALSRLREEGVIQGRWKQSEKRKAEKEPKGPLGFEPSSTPVHMPTFTPVRNAPEDLVVQVQKLVETLGTLTDVVDKLSCNAVMHALEIREVKGKDDFKIPLGLWTAYSRALLSDDKKYRDVFRDKVRKLLEASA